MAAKTRGGLPRAGVETAQSFTLHPVAGLVATDGVQRTAVATFGTTPVAIFDEIINPGYNMQLTELETVLEATFVGLDAAFVGSINFQWEMGAVFENPAGTLISEPLVSVTGTIEDATGTQATINRSFEGYVPVGSVPHGPIRLVLTAAGIRANAATGQVLNTSYLRMVGNHIPGS